MSVSVVLIVGLLAILAVLGTPTALVWGWIRWARGPKWNPSSLIFSFVALVFGTSSALLAGATIVYAQIHHFGFYDPGLLRIFRIGLLLSTLAMLLGFVGLGRPGSRRWQAPVSGLGMFAFWILATLGE